MSNGPEPLGKDKYAKDWSAYGVGLHTKRIFPESNEKWAKEFLNMDRSRIRRVVGVITEHCGLSKHLAKIGLVNDLNCGFSEEKSVHLISDCPKFNSLRYRTLGSHMVIPSTIPVLGPTVLDRFLVGTGRFV